MIGRKWKLLDARGAAEPLVRRFGERMQHASMVRCPLQMPHTKSREGMLRVEGTGEPSEPNLPEALSFMRVLWELDHNLRSCSKRMHATLKLTGPQRLALRLIGHSPGVAPSELADLLHVDRGTLTGILSRLVAKRMVSRRPDPADGRRVTLHLTPEGERLNRATAGTVEAHVRRVLQTLSPAQVGAARWVLEALSRELGARRRNGS